MYWGDVNFYRIETATINGTGRSILERENERAHYFSFLFVDRVIFITDWESRSVYLFSLSVSRYRQLYETASFN